MGEGDRVQLSRERIAAEAVRIIDRDGLDGLSMRRLGAALGVEAMSLYHYVASKDDLLDAVMAQLYNEIQIPALDDPTHWRQAVRSAMRSFYQVLVDHPAARTLFASRPAHSAEAILALHRGYRVLRDAGLAPRDAYAGLDFAVSYVMGHANEAFKSPNLGMFEGGPPDVINDPALAEFVETGAGFTVSDLFDRGLEHVISALVGRYELP